MAELSRVRFQEFAPRRNGEKQVGNTDRRASRKTRRLDANELPIRKFDARALRFGGIAGFEQQTRY